MARIRLFPILSIFSLFLVIGLLTPVFADEDETTQVMINFITESTIEYDSSDRLVRANVEILNYDPQDGYHFMRITNIATEEILRDTEIMPKYRGNEIWGVQIAYLIPDQIEKDEIVGDYLIEVYSEFGTAMSTTIFSVVDSSANNNLTLEQSNELVPLVTESSELETETIVSQESENEPLTVQELETQTSIPSESILPSWVRNIFIWYAEDTITESELIRSIEFLVDEGYIQIHSQPEIIQTTG